MSDAGSDPSRDALALCRRGEPVLSFGEGEPPSLLVAVRPGPAPADALPGDVGMAGLDTAFERLRQRSARESVRDALGRDVGYRLEDAAALAVRVPAELSPQAVEAWLRRRLGPGPSLSLLPEPGPLVLAAVLVQRQGFAPQRHRYTRDAEGRVHVEAFEIHVAEHCNLRCAHCCNMSPFVERKALSVEQIEATCDRMRSVLHADVIKIMGGEPLLHPEITEVIHVLRRSGVGDRVRLFTNGLRLRSMSDEFWAALDELTISNYQSAPVRPAILELARERARRHDFVLNIKEVGEFSQVLDPSFVPEDRARATFERCWLRHRCLIVRDDRFYMCTRAAYVRDFVQRVEHEAGPPGVAIVRDDDGVPLRGDGLAQRLEHYLNRDDPLGACHHCRGGDGGVVPHHQLSREQVRAGVLSVHPARTTE